MLDKASVTRRSLDFEDYIDVFRRNVSWIVGPIFAGLVISTVVAYLLQDTYVSSARIRIVPQQISDTLVQNASAQDMTDRINSMAQLILSRTTLTNLITTYGLYKAELKSEPMEDVVNKMHDAIGIRASPGMGGQGRGASLMEISYKYRDRMLANKICADLVSRFMNSSSQDTANGQLQANEFLKGEREKAKTEMDKAEQLVADFRGKHAGALPEEMQSNFAQMSAVQQRLNSLSDAATRASERRLMLDSSLRIAKDRLAAVRQTPTVSPARSERNNELERQISELETAIASMKDRYTADYPDLQSAQERLAVLRRQRDEASKAPAQKPSDAENPVMARERMDAQQQVEAIETQIKATSLEDAQISRSLLEANGQLRALQTRLSDSPAGEREYADLIRDRDVAKLKYLDLDAKMHKSNISKDLETAKQGETLELIDNPSLATDPTEPKRGLIIPIGAVGGMILGIVIVAIREVRDSSLKNLKDARVYTQLAILGSIPLLENDEVLQRRKQVTLVSWAIASFVGLAIVAGSVLRYYMSKV